MQVEPGYVPEQTSRQKKLELLLHSKHSYRKVLLTSFHLNGNTSAFHGKTKTYNRTSLCSIMNYLKKVLLSSFHLNGHTLGCHPQTQKLEPPCTT